MPTRLSSPRYSCIRSSSGCTFVGPRDKLREHETNTCRFRTFSCPGRSCNATVTYHDFASHMKYVHGSHEVKINDSTTEVTFEIPDWVHSRALQSWTFSPRVLKGMGTFIPMLSLQNGTFYLYVLFVGNQDMANNFRIEMKLSGTTFTLDLQGAFSLHNSSGQFHVCRRRRGSLLEVCPHSH